MSRFMCQSPPCKHLSTSLSLSQPQPHSLTPPLSLSLSRSQPPFSVSMSITTPLFISISIFPPLLSSSPSPSSYLSLRASLYTFIISSLSTWIDSASARRIARCEDGHVLDEHAAVTQEQKSQRVDFLSLESQHKQDTD